MSRRLPAFALALSLVILAGTPIAVWATRVHLDAGPLPVPASAQIDPGLPPHAGPARGVAPAGAEALGVTISVHPARLRDLKWAPRGPRPIRVVIPALGVDAPVVPVGIAPDHRTMEVPDLVSAVGWYRFGPSPGQAGSALIAGHVDDRTQGRGAFFGLSHLDPGEEVRVTLSNDRLRSFTVVARRAYPKGRLPAMVSESAGRPMLVLVTCGGSFDLATRHYANNVVVFAVPTGS